jgi:DNA polymerase/3'-5' exonuclease PolX
MSDKPKFPRAAALTVADWLIGLLEPHCTKIAVAGSLRRGRPEVGDVELVYVPRFGAQAAGLELIPDERTRCNLADVCLAELESLGQIERRLNVNGRQTYGAQNKLVRHVASRIPVDLFATTEDCWHNYLVCRTGGEDSNVAICIAAQRIGWKWNPTGPGFSRPRSDLGADAVETHAVTSERGVFDFVGLPYLEPEARR